MGVSKETRLARESCSERCSCRGCGQGPAPAQHAPTEQPFAGLLELQRMAGNRATTRLLQSARAHGRAAGVARGAWSGSRQVELPISRPHDGDERRAEEIAARVVQTPLGEPVAPWAERSRGRAVPVVAAVGVPAPRAVPAAAESSPEVMPVDERIARAIQQPSGGEPLPAGVRRALEPRFGVTFDGVRVHTGPEAESLAYALSARAFTFGGDIWLGSGEHAHDPGLMAHELVHVLQQNGTERDARGDRRVRRAARVARVMRIAENEYYAPPPTRGLTGPGTRAHSLLIPRILALSGNAELYSEINIPGGSRGGVAEAVATDARVGRADFYKASTTIGLNFEGDAAAPRFMGASAQARRGRTRFQSRHNRVAAPVATDGFPRRVRHPCPELASQQGICRMDTAPTEIGLGDLKPPTLGERDAGARQLNNYKEGIERTASRVNAFARSNPTLIRPTGSTWSPNVRMLDRDEDIRIPSRLQWPSTEGNYIECALIRSGQAVPRREHPYRLARPYLFRDTAHPGILYYEFIPIDHTGGPPVRQLRQAAQRATGPLGTLVGRLRDAPPRPRSRDRTSPTQDTFEFSEWRTSFLSWRRGEAAVFLRGRERSEIEHLAVLQAIERRSHVRLRVPTEAGPLSRELRRVQHWVDWGLVHGQFRRLFGRVYIKVVELYARARARFEEALERRRRARRSIPSGLPGVIARAALRMIQAYAALVASQTIQHLTSTVSAGVQAQLDELFDLEAIDILEDRIEELQADVRELQQAVEREFLDHLDAILEPYEEQLRLLHEVTELVQDLGEVVNTIKWAARIAACGLPPGLGCLWGILGAELVERAASRIAESCRFQREVIFPALTAIPAMRDLPRHLAEYILAEVRPLLPERIRPILGDARTVSQEQDTSSVGECTASDEGRVTPEEQEMIDEARRLEREYGEEMMQEVVRILLQRGLARRAPASLESLRHLGALLEELSRDGVSLEDLRAYRQESSRFFPTGRSLEEHLSEFRTDLRRWRGRRTSREEPGRRRRPELELRFPREGSEAPTDQREPGGGTILRF